MNKSSSMILEKFPVLKKHIKDCNSTILTDVTLSKLDNVEQVFLRLLWFFDNPSSENFNLEIIYHNLKGDWLSFALECIFVFFSQDTYLMEEPKFSVLTEDSHYFNQADFVKFLNEHKEQHERNFSRPMLNSYLKRGVIPKPDIELAGTKYWLKETCEKYLKEISINKTKVKYQD